MMMCAELRRAGDKITVTFILFAELKRAGDNITVTFRRFLEPGTK